MWLLLFFFSYFFLQRGEPSQWRVCYQCGLPHRVLLLKTFLTTLFVKQPRLHRVWKTCLKTDPLGFRHALWESLNLSNWSSSTWRISLAGRASWISWSIRWCNTFFMIFQHSCQDDGCSTPLLVAVESGSHETAKVPSLAFSHWTWFPLIHRSSYPTGRMSITATGMVCAAWSLLEDIFTSTCLGLFPLHIACTIGSQEIVQVLPSFFCLITSSHRYSSMPELK